MRNDVKNFLQKVALGGALVAATVGAQAATQGTTGTSSTGTVNINLQIDGAVKISNLADLDLGTFTGTGPLTASDAACVYSNSSTGYSVTATSSTGSFVLQDAGATNSIPFALTYDDGGAGGPATLSHGVTSGTMANASTIDDDCASSADNATVAVSVTALDASQVPQGAYSSVVTLVVAPL